MAMQNTEKIEVTFLHEDSLGNMFRPYFCNSTTSCVVECYKEARI